MYATFCLHQFSPSYDYPLTISKFISSPSICVIYKSFPDFPQENAWRAIFSERGMTRPKTICRNAIRCWKNQRELSFKYENFPRVFLKNSTLFFVRTKIFFRVENFMWVYNELIWNFHERPLQKKRKMFTSHGRSKDGEYIFSLLLLPIQCSSVPIFRYDFFPRSHLYNFHSNTIFSVLICL